MARTKRFVSRVNLVPRVDSRSDSGNMGQSVPRNQMRSTIRSSGGGVKKLGARWVKTLEEVQRWKEEKGSYPKSGRSASEDERRLYKWLFSNLPGKPCWSETRWSYLTNAFGEGWETKCFPFSGPEGKSKDLDSTWLKHCDQARQWREEKGSYPKYGKGSCKDERRLYYWLLNNLPGKESWSETRWSYLTNAFGKGWETECFKGNSKGLDSKWLQRCDQALQWKGEKGSYPKVAKGSSEDERRMYRWLFTNLPGKESWSETRWSYLTNAFGEGWESECFPFSGPDRKSRGLDSTWLRHCDQARQWKEEKGSYPKYGKGSCKDETRLYYWLLNNLPRKPCWSETRWSYLTGAFGQGWESECFPFRKG